MKQFASTLITTSPVFEPTTGTNESSLAGMADLASITAQSFAESMPVSVSVAAAVSVAAVVSVPAPSYTATRSEYRPALKDDRLAQALAQLQSIRQKNRASDTPRIVSSRFRQQEFIRVDTLGPAKIHRPGKPGSRQ